MQKEREPRPLPRELTLTSALTVERSSCLSFISIEMSMADSRLPGRRPSQTRLDGERVLKEWWKGKGWRAGAGKSVGVGGVVEGGRKMILFVDTYARQCR